MRAEEEGKKGEKGKRGNEGEAQDARQDPRHDLKGQGAENIANCKFQNAKYKMKGREAREQSEISRRPFF
jgi:hypothetical protein